MFLMFNATNALAVMFLVFLEGILSLDNALVLALMVKHLPQKQQRQALTWGIWGAFAFRFAALFFLSQIMRLRWVKVAGACYLFFVAIKGLVYEEDEKEQGVSSPASMFRTILLVELVDIAFSADSILAAVSVTQSYWIVMLGGLLGIVMMRFAAVLFIKLLRVFPRLATTAYLLVFTIAVKLMLEASVPDINFHDSHSPEGWAFWAAMIACIVYGLKKTNKRRLV